MVPPPAMPADDLDAGLTQARVTGELLLEVAAALEAMVGEAAQSEALTALEARTLQYVIEALPQYELAERLAVDPSRVTHVVRDLEARGLVAREVDRADRRVRIVTATAHGREVARRIGDRITAASPLLANLSAAERVRLERLLRKVGG